MQLSNYKLLPYKYNSLFEITSTADPGQLVDGSVSKMRAGYAQQVATSQRPPNYPPQHLGYNPQSSFRHEGYNPPPQSNGGFNSSSGREGRDEGEGNNSNNIDDSSERKQGTFIQKVFGSVGKSMTQDNYEIGEDITENKSLFGKFVGKGKEFVSDTMEVLFDIKTSSISRDKRPDPAMIWNLANSTDMRKLDPKPFMNQYIPNWEQITAKINTFELLTKYASGDAAGGKMVNRNISTTRTPALKNRFPMPCHLCSKQCMPNQRARVHFAPRQKTQTRPEDLMKLTKKEQGRRFDPNNIRDKPEVGYFCKECAPTAMSMSLWNYPLFSLNVYMPDLDNPVLCRDWDLEPGLEMVELPQFYPYSLMIGVEDRLVRGAQETLNEESWVNTNAEDVEQRFAGFGYDS